MTGELRHKSGPEIFGEFMAKRRRTA
jgi:hypothetical protein